MNTTSHTAQELIEEIFTDRLSTFEFEGIEYDASIVASVTKEIIEMTLEVSMDYIEELNRK